MSTTTDPTGAAHERRESPRLARRESVSIQLLLPCPDRTGCQRVVTTETADLSAGGLRLRLAEPLAAERILDLVVELSGHPRRFLLTGETRWCRPDAGGGYEVGMLIHDGVGTDYAEWAALLGGVS